MPTATHSTFAGRPPAIFVPLGFSTSRIVNAAAKLAHDAHWATARDDGSSYFEHVQRVAHTVARSQWATAHTVAAAYLHDAVEDTAVTFDAIASVCNDFVAGIVGLATKREGEDYHRQYIDRCASTPESFAIKAADLADNFSTLTPGDRRVQKYLDAMERLHASTSGWAH